MNRFSFTLGTLLIATGAFGAMLALVLALKLTGVLIILASALLFAFSRPTLLRLWIVAAAAAGAGLGGWSWAQSSTNERHNDFSWGYTNSSNTFGWGAALLVGAGAAYFCFVRRPPPNGPGADQQSTS